MTTKRVIATLDFETDPFKHGREVHPFACGLFDGEHYTQTWGDDCVAKMMNVLRCYPKKLLIYAHNGGKFDFVFLADYLSNPLMFIHTRLVKAKLFQHEVRDSYAILPVRLDAMQKDSIDYRIFEYGERDIPENKHAISEYLQDDCIYLHEHVTQFIETFGLKLTIGSTAMKTLKRFHDYEKLNDEKDAMLRPYYFGGRVQCFETGALRGNFECVDINSSYPFAMLDKDHPADGNIIETDKPAGTVYFAEIIADSRGALPVRGKAGLEFPHVEDYPFFACSHEIKAAEALGLLRVKKYGRVLAFPNTIRFDEFVNRCMAEKINAEKRGDSAMRLFWKLIANSAYGKFGQNPENYKDTKLFESLDQLLAENVNAPEDQRWVPKIEFGPFIIGERPTLHAQRLNVAIAASITSAARAHLLGAIASARRPIYCDTDSLICEHSNVRQHKTDLGAWKREALIDELYIAGRKTYAGYYKGEPVKLAVKGAILTPGQIRELVTNNTVLEYKRDAPSMRVFGPQKFITRKIRATA